MQALSLALLYLGSVSFFGLEAAKLDLASEFKRNLILEPANLHSRRHTSPPSPPLSHLNVVRLGCRLGTCHAHNLLDMVFHLMDKRKESAPPNKVHEYGRRRRRGDLGRGTLRPRETPCPVLGLKPEARAASEAPVGFPVLACPPRPVLLLSAAPWPRPPPSLLPPSPPHSGTRYKKAPPAAGHSVETSEEKARAASEATHREREALQKPLGFDIWEERSRLPASQWIINSIRMQALPLTLLYLGSVSFFGLEAAKLDLASDFKRKWNKWVRRDLNLAVEPLLRPQDAKDEPGMAQQPRLIPEPVHLRSRRHARQATPALSHLNVVRLGCRLGTCNTHNLAHMIFHLTDKEKDSSAPPNKIHDYGRRRRRRDLGDTFAARFTRSLGAHQRAGSLH
nr:pro-adrenomedullin [Anolis sagrei ordinatus]